MNEGRSQTRELDTFTLLNPDFHTMEREQESNEKLENNLLENDKMPK